MSTMLKRGTVILAVIATSLVFATAGLAQMPPSPWKKGAPFPEPDEELYGVAVNGKLYVIGGWGEGKARGANYEYDPALGFVGPESGSGGALEPATATQEKCGGGTLAGSQSAVD